MAPTTFHKFEDFASELRLEVWRLFLEDEAQHRRVVLWDGRVMPLAQLASPLLKVSVEARETALEFYSLKVDIYSLPDSVELFPLSQDRLRQIVAETGGEGEVQMQDIGEAEIFRALAKKAQGLLESAEMIAPSKGSLYLNPARDGIIHGYNCGVHFFVRNMTDLTQGPKDPDPLWHSFSSKVPASFFKSAKNVLRIQGPDTGLESLETSFFGPMDRPQGEEIIAWVLETREIDTAHAVLRLDNHENRELMSHILALSKPLPGVFEAWVGWTEQTDGQMDDVNLVKLEEEIEIMEEWRLAVVEEAERTMNLFDSQEETFTASEDANLVMQSFHAIESSIGIHIQRMKDFNTSFCAYLREYWA